MQEFIIQSIVGAELYKTQADGLRDAVEQAVKSRAYLRGAYLSGVYLSGAYLSGAYLRDADLSNADLRGAYLSGVYLSGAYLRDAYLRDADLSNADLRDADLSGADLSGADLRDADLRGAYLSGAYLSGAYLSGADLRGADGIVPERITPLLMLLDQPGPIRLYKLVDADLCSPMAPGNGHDKIRYAIGTEYRVETPDRDPTVQCGAGINVATLDWCLKEYQPSWRVLIAEFTAADVACIPTATDGKLRLSRCRIVGEKDITALLPAKDEAVAS